MSKLIDKTHMRLILIDVFFATTLTPVMLMLAFGKLTLAEVASLTRNHPLHQKTTLLVDQISQRHTDYRGEWYYKY